MAVTRGRHKVFLGMAAGVGKTYRMLQEGQAEALLGRDVVIGYLEPHGRLETLEQAAGLEVVPRRRVEYRDTQLEEMDLPGVLRRDPELCLIDELAHTNAPGTEHPKRYEDVQDVLATGIDVYSSVNVQHLESLNDQVAELTGTRVRETVPDAVLAAADDVVLIDITPDSLIERLLAGKVYPQERVQAALNNFFKVENLSALREVSLRQVAEEVEHKRNPLQEDGGRPGIWLECVTVRERGPTARGESGNPSDVVRYPAPARHPARGCCARWPRRSADRDHLHQAVQRTRRPLCSTNPCRTRRSPSGTRIRSSAGMNSVPSSRTGSAPSGSRSMRSRPTSVPSTRTTPALSTSTVPGGTTIGPRSPSSARPEPSTSRPASSRRSEPPRLSRSPAAVWTTKNPIAFDREVQRLTLSASACPA